MLDGGAVSWKSTKQQCFIKHCRTEWHAASEAGKEIIYLRSILFDFGFEQDGPTKMYADSRAIIAMADNPVNRKESRHIDTSKLFTGELVQDKHIELAPCATGLMVAGALAHASVLETQGRDAWYGY